MAKLRTKSEHEDESKNGTLPRWGRGPEFPLLAKIKRAIATRMALVRNRLRAEIVFLCSRHVKYRPVQILRRKATLSSRWPCGSRLTCRLYQGIQRFFSSGPGNVKPESVEILPMRVCQKMAAPSGGKGRPVTSSLGLGRRLKVITLQEAIVLLDLHECQTRNLWKSCGCVKNVSDPR